MIDEPIYKCESILKACHTHLFDLQSYKYTTLLLGEPIVYC